jgi:hypothetical protein
MNWLSFFIGVLVECGSEQVRLGVLDITCSEPQDVVVGQILSLSRFEQRGKLAAPSRSPSPPHTARTTAC